MKDKHKHKEKLNVPSYGLIISTLVSLSEYLYNKFKESFFYSLFCKQFKDRGIGLSEHACERIKLKQKVTVPFKRAVASASEKSFILSKLRELSVNIPSLQIKSVGGALFSFGLFTSIIYLFKVFAFDLVTTDPHHLYLGIFTAVIGGLLTSTAKSFAEAANESKLLFFLLTSVFGVKPQSLNDRGKKIGRGDIGFMIGALFGLFTTLLSPFDILLSLLILICACFILRTPEAGVVIILAIFPFLCGLDLCLLCGFVVISWLIKLSCGKRTLALNVLDISAVAFSAVIFFSGVVSVTPKQSFPEAVGFLMLISGYFLTVNLIKTSKWLIRCVSALIFSLSSVTVISTLSLIGRMLPDTSAAGEFFSLISELFNILFPAIGSFTEFVILTLPFLLVFVMTADKGDTRFGLSIMAVLAVISAILSLPKEGAAILIISVGVFLFFYSRKTFAFMMLLSLSAPIALALLPTSVQSSLFSFDSLAYSEGRILIWTSLDEILSDYFVGGIGFGSAPLEKIFPLYSSSLLRGFTSSGDLYTSIILFSGILGLIIFLILIAAFIRHFASYYNSSKNDETPVRLISLAGFSSMVGAVIMGAADFIWKDPKTVLLFFTAIGLSSAAARVGVKERIEKVDQGIFLDIELSKQRPRIK